MENNTKNYLMRNYRKSKSKFMVEKKSFPLIPLCIKHMSGITLLCFCSDYNCKGIYSTALYVYGCKVDSM